MKLSRVETILVVEALRKKAAADREAATASFGALDGNGTMSIGLFGAELIDKGLVSDVQPGHAREALRKLTRQAEVCEALAARFQENMPP